MAAMGLATLVIAIDFTAFSVALPSMERDLHASLATVQWVINAYAVVFGVVIVTGGRLADMLGRRTRLFNRRRDLRGFLPGWRARPGPHHADRVPGGDGSRRRARCGPP